MTSSKTIKCVLLVLTHHAQEVWSPSSTLEDSNLSSALKQYRLQRKKRTLTFLLNVRYYKLTGWSKYKHIFQTCWWSLQSSRKRSRTLPLLKSSLYGLTDFIFLFHVNCIDFSCVKTPVPHLFLLCSSLRIETLKPWLFKNNFSTMILVAFHTDTCFLFHPTMVTSLASEKSGFESFEAEDGAETLPPSYMEDSEL